ncbi:MAG: hypothetical protein SangKO_067100 [Sandaracinaceae bacterium]
MQSGNIWVGVVASTNAVVVVQMEGGAGDQPSQILADDTVKVERGNRPKALRTLHQRLVDLGKNIAPYRVVVKASAMPPSGGGKALLSAAEVRGVVQAALAESAPVEAVARNIASRRFGERDFSSYIDDDEFWAENTRGKLRKGSREAALLVLAAIDQENG